MSRVKSTLRIKAKSTAFSLLKVFLFLFSFSIPSHMSSATSDNIFFASFPLFIPSSDSTNRKCILMWTSFTLGNISFFHSSWAPLSQMCFLRSKLLWTTSEIRFYIFFQVSSFPSFAARLFNESILQRYTQSEREFREKNAVEWENSVFFLVATDYIVDCCVCAQLRRKVLTARFRSLFVSQKLHIFSFYIYVSFSAFSEHNMQASDSDVGRCFGERLGSSLGVRLSRRSQRRSLSAAVAIAGSTMLEHSGARTANRQSQGRQHSLYIDSDPPGSGSSRCQNSHSWGWWKYGK